MERSDETEGEGKGKEGGREMWGGEGPYLHLVHLVQQQMMVM